MMLNDDVNNRFNKTKCVIFDCGGTLVDSENFRLEGVRMLMEDINIDLKISDLKRKYQGLRTEDIMTSLQKEYRRANAHKHKTLVHKHLKICKKLFSKHLRTVDGVDNLLEELKSRGIDVCIASNANHQRINLMLKATGLTRKFKGKIFSSSDVLAAKPKPDVITFAVESMGYRRQECLFIDDSIVGVKAGISANIRTLYFSHDAQITNEDILAKQIFHISETIEHL